MNGYVDVFVIPVPRDRTADYKRLAQLSAEVWRDAGALAYVEVAADDVKPGKVTSFPQSVDLQEGEMVVVGLVTYLSRAHRDAVNERAMADPRLKDMGASTLPFDGKRMFWGGFGPFVGMIATPAVQPYVFFRGRCEEAIEYYRRVLGAEVEMIMRFRDNPDDPQCDQMPPGMADKVMHASLRIAGAQLMMSDGMATGPLDFQCMSLSLLVANEAECERLFAALAADGTVQMPLGRTFFAKLFGAVADRFGVSWMFMVAPDEMGEPS